MGQKSKNKCKPTMTVEPIEDSEDYCFICKDGGDLILCDHENCTKAYHQNCSGRRDSRKQLICGWHHCCKCRKSASIGCICCPNAVCEVCIVNNEEFAQIRGLYGICDECLKLVMMVEEGRDVDSEGEEADFNDRDSMEGLFKEYWEIVRDKENLTLKDLQDAKAQMENSKSSSKRSHSDEDEAHEEAWDADHDIEVTLKNKSGSKKVKQKRQKVDADCDIEVTPKNKSGSKKVRQKQQKEDKGSKKREFLGWGSKSLIEFLHSIGKDTSQKLSQSEVAEIMIMYAREKNLFDTGNKKKIICDDALHSVLGRKSLTIYKIRDFLEYHFLENIEDSDEDEHGYSSEAEDLKCLLSSKKLKKHSTIKTCQKKDTTCKKFFHEDNASPVVLYSRYASIVPENIKLVYLKRSLVEELLEKPESFDHKVIGSFVKVKSVSMLHKRYYELLQVTDIKRLTDGNKKDVVLKLSGMTSDVLISMLSDDDFSEEEFEELSQKVEKGILEKLTIVDLQQKVYTLHEDITKHAIARELIVLQHRIDLANEKGWRDQFYEFGQSRKLLQNPEEQARRLQNVPKVTADVIEVDAEPGSKELVQNESS